MSEQKQSRYLDYLPAIYREPFLGQFLLPFEAIQQEFRDLLSDIDRYFAPLATDADFLPWLASWLALTLDETWTDLQRRRIMTEAIALYRWRGTVSGLKRYLQIYTDIVPEIHESSWPGGIQIGVASRIGGTQEPLQGNGSSAAIRIERTVRRQPTFRDYYIVDTVAPSHHYCLEEGETLRILFPTDKVRRIEADPRDEEPWVKIELHNDVQQIYRPATIIRRDGLIDDRYVLTIAVGDEMRTIQFEGDTTLVDRVDRPYHFIVEIQATPAEWNRLREPEKIQSILSMLDLEKPAHTEYYLKVSRQREQEIRPSIRIGEGVRVGLNTTIG